VGPLSVTDPQHNHALSANSTGFATGSYGSVNRFETFGTQASPGNVSGNTYNASTGITVAGVNSASETRPMNYSVLYCIAYGFANLS